MLARYRRVLWALLSGIAGLMAGVATAVFAIIFGASVFWLFIFGDEPWPETAQTLLVVGAYCLGALACLTASRSFWRYGAKRRQTRLPDR